MGSENKLLLSIKGKPIIDYVFDTVSSKINWEVVVVTKSRLIRDKAKQRGFNTVCPIGEECQSNSLKAGLTGISAQVKGIFFILGDQPFVSTNLLDNMEKIFSYLNHINSPRNIVAPFYNNRRSTPILMSTEYLSQLKRITGDQGARGVIEAHRNNIFSLKIHSEKLLLDIDNPQDYIDAQKFHYGKLFL